MLMPEHNIYLVLRQVVLEVIDENVAQGSRVYEEGHVRYRLLMLLEPHPKYRQCRDNARRTPWCLVLTNVCT